MNRPAATNRSGFTLVEVLMAIALGTILLVAATGFLSDMAFLYARERHTPATEQHAETLVRFLAHLLRTAEPADQTSGEPGEGGTGPALSWEQLPDASPADDPLLAFRYAEDAPPIDEGEAPVFSRHCYLAYEENLGLVLFWYPEHEREASEAILRRSLLSAQVTALRYYTFDEDREDWEEIDSFLDGEENRPLPDLLELDIRLRDDLTRTFTLPLKTTNTAGAPVY